MWSTELNAGHPLWPLTESLGAMDPVACLLWWGARLADVPTIYVFQSVCIAWLFLFAVGGMLLSRRIIHSWWINLGVFTLLFGGPIGWAMAAQWSFIAPFRYAPFALMALLRLYESPTVINAVLFGTAGGFATSGYQSNYLFLFLAVFIFIYAFLSWSVGRRVFPERFWSRLSISVAIVLVLNLPLLAVGSKLLSMVAVARLHFASFYAFPGRWFLEGFFGLKVQSLQGGGYLGIAAVLVCIPFLTLVWRVLCGLLRRVVPLSCPRDLSPFEFTWLLCVFPLGGLVLGLVDFDAFFREHTVLGLRNWGFLMTIVLLGMSQLFAAGAARLGSHDKSDKYLFVLFAVSLLALMPFMKAWTGVAYSVFVYFWIPVCALAAFIFMGRVLKREVFALWVFILCAGTLSLRKYYPGEIPFRVDLFHYPQVISRHYPKPAMRRGWEYEPYLFYPYVVSGPALVHAPYAVMAPKQGILIVDLLNLPRYNALLRANVCSMAILGVSSPIAYAVGGWVPSEGPKSSELSLTREEVCKLVNETAVLEGELPNDLLTGESPVNKSLDAAIVFTRYTDVEARFDVNMPKDGFLVYSDNWDEGWRVHVDGKRKPLLIANLTNKAVFLEKGAHSVRFTYRPVVYILTFWFRVFFYICAFMFLVWLWLKKSREAHGLPVS